MYSTYVDLLVRIYIFLNELYTELQLYICCQQNPVTSEDQGLPEYVQ